MREWSRCTLCVLPRVPASLKLSPQRLLRFSASGRSQHVSHPPDLTNTQSRTAIGLSPSTVALFPHAYGLLPDVLHHVAGCYVPREPNSGIYPD